ncbi:phospholipase A2 inhibitor and Ly6/PLAUR domain-containing protein-like isoform X2 [Centropristis striata]|uniref:phospholipase A2 inhibitor and Ly6/PLAUR domain-containing protein-like isoform X2 n=1 Tax=Centropristis striata TaxID=184440 RepID=UPI0027DF3637|nr:phospholipase A2 inhibitor and Ly6/PLAUR domain-containing protein-like isoform X2 [Centropristis striata]
MKLIVSLTLFLMLSSTAGLKCQTSSGLQPCASDDQLCATIAVTTVLGNEESQSINQTCVLPALCRVPSHRFSLSSSGETDAFAVHCCNTDGCNSQTVSYPDVTENSLQCFTCSGTVCNQTVQCVGAEDRCFHQSHHNKTFVDHGCMSANLCDVHNQKALTSALSGDEPDSTDEPDTIAIECCASSFCNSAVTLPSV